MSEWTDVFAIDKLNDGEHTSVEVDGVSMAVFNLAGEIYAIENICTHDGSEIASGCIVDGTIECPRHGARFDIRTGEVTAPPAYEAVDIFPVRIVDGRVQVRDDRWD